MWTKEYKQKYHRDYHKKWYEKNKERRKRQIREYGLAHREDSVRRTQKYAANNRKRVAESYRRFGQTIKGKYRLLIYRAKHWAGTPITIEQYAELLSKSCQYCGEKEGIGIDRIDNTKGYLKENSAPSCKLCNFMKKALTKEEFISHIKKIANYQSL